MNLPWTLRLAGGAWMLFGVALVLFSAALLFFDRLGLLAILATARFLERGHALLFGFAQHTLLALARRLVARGGLRRWLGRSNRSRRGGRLGHGCRRRFGLAGLAQHAAPLDLDHDGVRAAMAEALLHLAGLDRALQAQRCAGAQFRLFVIGIAHSKSSVVSSAEPG